MAKPTRTILFIAAELSKAQAAATTFASAADRLGLSWSAESRAVDDVTAAVVATVQAVVAVDLPDFAVPLWTGRLDRLATSPSLDESVNGLLARLLGGNDQAVIRPPTIPPPPKKVHTIKVSRETAGRRGRGVTVVADLPLTGDQLKELATQLKNACGTGGTAKDGRIEIQGDQRDRLVTELEKLGYRVKRAGG
jgi:translation initiation factor 1